jgi:hypothetical protein
LVIKLNNVVAEHNLKFTVDYNFGTMMMVQEPALLTGGIARSPCPNPIQRTRCPLNCSSRDSFILVVNISDSLVGVYFRAAFMLLFLIVITASRMDWTISRDKSWQAQQTKELFVDCMQQVVAVLSERSLLMKKLESVDQDLVRTRDCETANSKRVTIERLLKASIDKVHPILHTHTQSVFVCVRAKQRERERERESVFMMWTLRGYCLTVRVS